MSSVDREVRTHELKSWPVHFQRVWGGSIFFDLRKNDRGYQEGDLLNLREYDPVERNYSGRRVLARVSSVVDSVNGDGLQLGYVVLGILPYARIHTELPTYRQPVAPPEPKDRGDPDLYPYEYLASPPEDPEPPAGNEPLSGEETPDLLFLKNEHYRLQAEYERLKAEHDALELDKLKWEQRANHADAALKEAEDRLRIARGEATEDLNFMGPYEPSRENDVVTVRYGAWFQQARLKASAEVDRDSARKVLTDTMALINDQEPAYNVAIVRDAVADLQRSTREMEKSLFTQRQENTLLRDRLRAVELGKKADAARSLPAPERPHTPSLWARALAAVGLHTRTVDETERQSPGT